MVTLYRMYSLWQTETERWSGSLMTVAVRNGRLDVNPRAKADALKTLDGVEKEGMNAEI